MKAFHEERMTYLKGMQRMQGKIRLQLSSLICNMTSSDRQLYVIL